MTKRVTSAEASNKIREKLYVKIQTSDILVNFRDSNYTHIVNKKMSVIDF